MAAPERKTFTVERNNAFLTCYPWKHPTTGKWKWRYGWRKREDEAWKYVTRSTKERIKDSAWEKLGEISEGGIIWSDLSPEVRRFLEDVHRLTKPADYPAVLALLETRNRSAEIVESVKRFLAWKISNKGEETRHLGNMKRVLDPMAESFKGRSIADIHDADLMGWWKSRVTRRDEKGEPMKDAEGRPVYLSKKSCNDVRAVLVEFWNWAILEKLHPKESTPADKLPRQELDNHERRVLTPQEMVAVFDTISEEWRAWAVLGAFCGLRPEEIAPAERKGYSKGNKRGIRCEEIDFRFKVIRLPAEVSKGGKRPRNVPLCDAALAWLAWAGIKPGMTGPVCRRNPCERPKKEPETIRIGKEVFKTGWPQDALRHSYGSYRNALIRNMPAVAEEMGTSVAMLNRHYHNPKALEEGQEWFALRPKGFRCVPMEASLGSKSEVISRKSFP
ncbi:hypothetical protein [Luteolibacter luteus]|uniref:Tyr recombinase domain-containing protein n=1 Tax=Luteolibacter luteus TaxID=2728835 RepID=A0A858RFC1_9BACT|nr:hypothetical protein [Luteolibacter luteus]QJE95248.1 hypothetical protein HHL09_05480 [Luteolibacter luteus]